MRPDSGLNLGHWTAVNEQWYQSLTSNRSRSKKTEDGGAEQWLRTVYSGAYSSVDPIPVAGSVDNPYAWIMCV